MSLVTEWPPEALMPVLKLAMLFGNGRHPVQCSFILANLALCAVAHDVWDRHKRRASHAYPLFTVCSSRGRYGIYPPIGTLVSDLQCHAVYLPVCVCLCIVHSMRTHLCRTGASARSRAALFVCRAHTGGRNSSGGSSGSSDV